MQRRSTKLQNVEPPDQLTLLPEREPIVSRPVNLDHIGVLSSTAQALEYACQLASVTPKQVYPYMDCDKTVWSRICSGELDLDGRDIPQFNKVIGNSAYLLYLAHVEGWDLTTIRKVRDDKDRRIAELEQKVADQDRAIRLMVEYNRGGRGG
jgi:hypothetical protein